MRKFGFLILAAAVADPFAAVAQPTAQPGADPKVAALATTLKTAMATAEQHATAAAFPRKNILAAVSRSMWETFYHTTYTSAQEAAAVDEVAAEADTPILKEAATRMKYELQLN